MPLPIASMPLSDPVTEAAAIETPAPLASLDALIPTPLTPVTDPLTLIRTAPPPALRATMPPFAPVTACPFADWVNEMPPVPPVCVKVNASPSAPIGTFRRASTGVSECSFTSSATVPVALRDCFDPIRPTPLQVNAPGVPDTGSHSLAKNRTRSKALPVPSACNL